MFLEVSRGPCSRTNQVRPDGTDSSIAAARRSGGHARDDCGGRGRRDGRRRPVGHPRFGSRHRGGGPACGQVRAGVTLRPGPSRPHDPPRRFRARSGGREEPASEPRREGHARCQRRALGQLRTSAGALPRRAGVHRSRTTGGRGSPGRRQDRPARRARSLHSTDGLATGGRRRTRSGSRARSGPRRRLPPPTWIRHRPLSPVRIRPRRPPLPGASCGAPGWTETPMDRAATTRRGT